MASKSSRYSVTLLALRIVFFMSAETYFLRNVLETCKQRETTNIVIRRKLDLKLKVHGDKDHVAVENNFFFIKCRSLN